MQRAAAVVARACPLRVQTDRRARAPNAHRRPTRGVVANRAGADVASSSSSVTAEEEDRREPAAMPDAPPHQGYYRWPALHGWFTTEFPVPTPACKVWLTVRGTVCIAGSTVRVFAATIGVAGTVLLNG